MKLKSILFMSVSLIVMLFFSGCNNGNNQEEINKIQQIAYSSLSAQEKEEVVDKEKAEINRIEDLPDNTYVVLPKYSKDHLYSVTFKSSNPELGDIILFVDIFHEKTIGYIIRK
ncbi:hypothetical protein [Mangrovibacillus cuniculi]|uniref:Lipoprotein n=1 Tax=Mangrovibacillus cuniculi TaxID=2593652 RepID=A0A7S8HE94_9BACI|nr:hypothetical protein [Mangrovibacillus cuniculi]QPC45604.1 hypothetical protein G8O30_00740 [Mangrovibacillus cuniculi]